MSVSLKVIHGCDHIVTSKEKIYGKFKMIRSLNAGFPDKFPANIQIIRIDSIENSSGFEYTKLVDYEQKVSKDIIEWINPSNNPLLGEEYYVNALYLKIETRKFSEQDCSRCAGNGWFVDLLCEDSKLISGKSKLAQDFIKILFTEKNKDSYGSTIKDVLAGNVYDEIELGIKVSSSIEDCAYQIKKSQQSMISSGIYLPDSEAFGDVTVHQCIFSREECACYISITILNVAGEKINFSFKI